jgi:hypothetical protein
MMRFEREARHVTRQCEALSDVQGKKSYRITALNHRQAQGSTFFFTRLLGITSPRSAYK